MPKAEIADLHAGMNLRDAAAAVAQGEIGLSYGCDFSVPGQVSPMRQPLLDQTLPAVIQDAADVYLAGVKYRFTTHADGLRVTSAGTTTLIDAAFTGTFKIIPLNDEYVVLSNGSLSKKWMPGWPVTQQWGLNTPPDPVIYAGSPLTKVVEDFQTLTDWTNSGGSLAADTNYIRGLLPEDAQSMKLAIAAGSTITAARVLGAPLDLSMFLEPGDSGIQPYLQLSFFSVNFAYVQLMTIKLSCQPDGGFDTDYFQVTLNLGGMDNVQLDFIPQGGVMVPVVPTAAPVGFLEVTQGAYNAYQGADTNPSNFQTLVDTDGVVHYYTKEDSPALTVTTVSVPPYQPQVLMQSNAWTDLQMPLNQFTRVGSRPGLGWNTISALRIELTAVTSTATVYFNDWQMMGGGELIGNYYVAIAYQNALGNYGPYTPYIGPVSLNSQSLTISNLVPDTDQQTVARRIAILGGTLTQPMVAYLNDNTTQAWDYNAPINTLTEVEVNFNNKPPPPFVDMMEWLGQIFGVIGDGSLYYSVPLFYEAFPALNYLLMLEDEKLIQVDVSDQNYVACRGKGQEYLTQLTGAGPAYWQTIKGADVGAVSSRFLMKDPLTGGRVYASQLGFYISGGGQRGYYLPKIPPGISNPNQPWGVGDFSLIFGAQMSDRAYLYLQDKAGKDWVLRIDCRLGSGPWRTLWPP